MDYCLTEIDYFVNFVSVSQLIFIAINPLYSDVALCLLGVCCNFFLTLILISYEG